MFRIPNEAQAFNPNQAEPDKVDVDILVSGIGGQGVVSGCEVSALTSAGMAVRVALGAIAIAGALVAISGDDVMLEAAESSPRFDLIVAYGDDTIEAIKGEGDVEPIFPEVPSNAVALAAVYVPAGVTEVVDDYLVDKRVPVLNPETYLTEAQADLLYDTLGAASAAVAAHEGAANPHPQYLTQAEGDALYSGLAHNHDHNELSNLLGGATDDYYHLTSAQLTDLTDGGATTLHKHDHGALDGLGDNDHPQYLLVADIDDTPVNGELAQPISSNWAFDHIAAADPHTGYVLESALDELAQDAVGGILTDTATIDLVYNDGAGTITANVLTVPVVDAGGDTTTFVALFGAATGNLAPLTDAGLTYNATSNALTAASFVGALTGNASTATALATARTIGGVNFDGTANIVPQTIQVVDSSDTTSFVAMFDSATGNLQPKTDAGLLYDASSSPTLTLTGGLPTLEILATATEARIELNTPGTFDWWIQTNSDELTLDIGTGASTARFRIGTGGLASQLPSDLNITGDLDVSATLNVDGATTLSTLDIATGTITDPATALEITQTWNDAADTFNALDINITDTASASGSALQRWIVGGSTLAALYKTGNFGLTGILTVGGQNAPTGGTRLYVGDGVRTAVFGADATGTTLTDATQKVARIGYPHYTNAEEVCALFTLSSNAGSNSIALGGGTSLMNAATSLSFYTAADDTTVTGTLRMFIDSVGAVFIDDTQNANMTIGLTINQGSADDEIFALKSSDVAHGLTALTETDTWMYVRKSSATGGGGHIRGFAESGSTVGIRMDGHAGTAITTPSTTARGFIELGGYQTSGTGDTNSTANAIVLSLRTQVGGAERTILCVDEDGDLFLDGAAGAAFDDFDDLALLEAFEAQRAPQQVKGLVHQGRYAKADLVRAKLLSDPEDGEPLYNFAQLGRLQSGALRQLDKRLMAVEAALKIQPNRLH